MALRTPDPDTLSDSSIPNEGDTHYEQQVTPQRVTANQLQSLENNYNSSPDASDIGDIENFANNPANHSAAVTGFQERNPTSIPSPLKDLAPTVTGKKAVKGKGSFFKRKGPMSFLITVLLGGGLGIGALFAGPSFFLINIAQVLQQKFDTGYSSLDNRSNRILQNKVGQDINSLTNTVCTSVTSALCRYSSLSQSEVDGFAKAGIITDENAGKTFVRGKVKPTSFTFEGKQIPASEFASEMGSNPAFKSAVETAVKYNAKYAGLSGKIFQYVEQKLGFSKADPFKDTGSSTADETDAERLQTVEDEVSNGEAVNVEAPTVGEGDSSNLCGSSKCSAADQARVDQASSNLSKIESSATADATTALSTADSFLKTSASTVGNSLSLTGYAQDACTAYGGLQAVGFAAKTVRLAQLARYAMIFLTTADMIKAGVATSGDVNFVSNTASTPYTYSTTDSSGKVTTVSSSFTDSLAYRNAAFGDTGKLNTVASNYLVAGGLTGTLLGISQAIESVLGGTPSKICGFLGNPIVSGVSLAAGIGLLLVPGVNIAIGAKDIAQTAASVLLTVSSLVLPGMLKDIIAGKIINNKTVGEAAADAAISGVGAIMSTNAQYGGNAPLSPQQAADAVATQNQSVAMLAAQDRLAASPFDATDPNTFLGTIVTDMSPYMSDFSSVAGLMSASSSLISNSFSTIFIPTTKAAATAANYSTCNDPIYSQLNGGTGVATDLFCNPIRGIPPQYLNNAPSPVDLTSQLISQGDIDPTTGDPTSTNTPSTQAALGMSYDSFVSQCIYSSANASSQDSPENVLGGTGSDTAISQANQCFINSQAKADYYIHYIDQRALDQMENGMDDQANGGSSSTSSSTSSTAGVTFDQATLYQDSTSVACASGTTDDGTAQGYRGGKEINIRLCSLPNTIDTNHSNQPAKVNARVSGAFLAMTKALASAENTPTLTVADSFRSMADQQQAYKTYGSPRAALPGYSNHQMGLAIDFQLKTGNVGATKPAGSDPVYDWLVANASQYGMTKLPSEAWHWQPTGADGS